MIEHYLDVPSRLSDSHSKGETNFKVPTLFKWPEPNFYLSFYYKRDSTYLTVTDLFTYIAVQVSRLKWFQVDVGDSLRPHRVIQRFPLFPKKESVAMKGINPYESDLCW